MGIVIGSIYIELTSRCNLHCPYCYHGDNANNQKTDISIAIFSKLVSELVGLDCYSIELSGGEPLLHPEIMQIIKLAEQNNIGIKLITNGTMLNLLNEESVTYIDEIAISIDGITNEDHNALRGKGAFEQIAENLSYLKALGAIDKVFFSFTINKSNCHKILDFINFGCEQKVGGVNFNELHATPILNSSFIKNETLSKNELLALRENLESYKYQYDSKIRIIPNREIGGDCPLLHDDTPTTLRIDCDGNVYLCEGFCGRDYSIGNIGTDSLANIVNSDRALKYLTFFKERINLIDKCRSCFLKNSFCYGGCAVDAYYRQADCLITDDWCEARIQKAIRELKTNNSHKEKTYAKV